MQEATQVGRIIIPTEKIPRPGGPRDTETQANSKQEARWHGVAILYSKETDAGVELRLFYESHVSQAIKDAIAARFGIGAVEWDVKCD